MFDCGIKSDYYFRISQCELGPVEPAKTKLDETIAHRKGNGDLQKNTWTIWRWTNPVAVCCKMNMVYLGSRWAESKDTRKLQEHVFQSPMCPKISLNPLPTITYGKTGVPFDQLKEEEKPHLVYRWTGYYVNEAENQWRLHYNSTQEGCWKYREGKSLQGTEPWVLNLVIYFMGKEKWPEVGTYVDFWAMANNLAIWSEVWKGEDWKVVEQTCGWTCRNGHWV